MKKQPLIQKTSEKDLSDLVKIHKKCINITNAKMYTEDVIKEWLETIDKRNILDQLETTQWYTIKYEDITVGFAQFDINKNTLYQIQVDPDFQNKGFGEYLLKFILNEFKKHGVRKVTLFSTLNAVPFYLSFGFVRIKKIEFPLKICSVSMVEMAKYDL